MYENITRLHDSFFYQKTSKYQLRIRKCAIYSIMKYINIEITAKRQYKNSRIYQLDNLNGCN